MEAVNGSGGVIDTDVTSANGQYSVTVPANADVQIRVIAQIVEDAIGDWDIAVRDNTNADAIYTLVGSLTSSGAADSTRNLNAPSGWNGSSYAGVRAAAPFAILDTLKTSLLSLVDTANNSDQIARISVPPGQVLWSPQNRAMDGEIEDGDIGSTSFTRIGGVPTILLQGEENNDTDEYDEHVVSHEFGHYIHDQLSRSDSIGGPHSLNDELDPRVSFGEGWASLFAGLTLESPIYVETFGAQQGQGFVFNLDTFRPVQPGWYNEATVFGVIYDFAVGAAPSAVGETAVFEALFDPAFAESVAPTTIFSYLEALKANPAASPIAIETRAAADGINGSGIFGDGETNTGGIPDALPVVRPLTVGAAPIEFCSVDDAGTFNKLGNRELIRFTANAARNHMFSMTLASGPTGRDPDFFIFQAENFINVGGSADVDTETLTTFLNPADYWVDAFDFLNTTEDGPSGDTCWNFSVN